VRVLDAPKCPRIIGYACRDGGSPLGANLVVSCAGLRGTGGVPGEDGYWFSKDRTCPRYGGVLIEAGIEETERSSLRRPFADRASSILTLRLDLRLDDEFNDGCHRVGSAGRIDRPARGSASFSVAVAWPSQTRESEGGREGGREGEGRQRRGQVR